jgi:hypothetical protein
MAGRVAKRVRWLLLAATSLIVAISPPAAIARTVVARPPERASHSVVLNGLENPREVAWGSDGLLYVSLAGASASAETLAAEAAGAPVPGTTASVVRVEDGRLTTLIGGWPAGELSSLGWQFLEMHLTVLDGRLYLLEAAGGADQGQIAYAGILYRVGDDRSLTQVANLRSWVNTPHLPALPAVGPPSGRSLFALTAAGGAFWIADGVNHQVLRINLAGGVTRFVGRWKTDAVLAGLAPAPDGGVYIGFATTASFADGASRVAHLTPHGRITDVWLGLTALANIDVGPEGVLYAAELSSGQGAVPPDWSAVTGKIVRQTGPATQADVVTKLDAPAGLRFGPDGGLYVVGPAVGGGVPVGTIVRFSLDAPTPIAPIADDVRR